jgi:hypothetical protein
MDISSGTTESLWHDDLLLICLVSATLLEFVKVHTFGLGFQLGRDCIDLAALTFPRLGNSCGPIK